MIKPQKPAEEVARLQELNSLEILDSADESDFDEMVALAAHLTNCPIALVSLVDFDRQWFKAKFGMDTTQFPRDISFCGHAILGEGLLLVENTLDDERFKDNPLVVGESHIRFYAGAPLVTSNGHRIGTLCTMDKIQRQLSQEQTRHLASLARQIVKLMELRLAKRQLELRALTKTQFLANMSHEIRTPLNSILGYASIAAETLALEQGSAKIPVYLRNIDRHSKHILSVVSNVLDIATIESGKVQLEALDFSVDELRLYVLSLFELDAEKKGLGLSIEIANGTPEFLSADFTRLKQIFTNLVSNAMKFTERGAIKALIEYDKAASLLKISVGDTGSGLSPEQRTRLFKPFVQADSSIARKHGGTGLGLALSRQLAEAMGGGVDLIRSAPGEGCLFVISVKAQPAVDAVEKLTLQSAAMVKTLRAIGGLASILVADDSEDNRYIFKHSLKQFSMTSDETSDGNDILNLIVKKHYDVIFLDMQIADQDGFTMLENIRRVNSRVKVVAFTANGTEMLQDKIRKAGFNSFLGKPFETKEMAKVLFESLVDFN